MCGINGYITTKVVAENQKLKNINLMNNAIVHRGPDDDGIFEEINSAFSIAMGMRRLAIIDLHSGKQPIFSEDKQIIIVFNGEIYNYKILRTALEQEGVTFTTHSDTEVILKLYEHEGTNSFKKLDGMFAFSIYDKKLGKVFIARDFFGEKPLYYTQQKGHFIWASELKSIVKTFDTNQEISVQGLNLYFKLTYIPAPFTIYQGIYKLEANKFITIDVTTQEFTVADLSATTKHEKKDIPFSAAKAQVKHLVQESVESRSVSDVPIGTFLSGGVDSSVVSLCLAQQMETPINTFSIGFEKKSFDESDKARTVAKLIGSKHHEFTLNEQDLESNIHKILVNFDEPFADSSSLPSYFVAHKTSEHVKVALTGDGGDEVFGGYNKYYMGAINQKYTGIIPKAGHNFIDKIAQPLLKTKDDNRGLRFKAKRLLQAIDYTDNYYWDIISLGFSGNSLSAYVLPHYYEASPFTFYKEKTGIHAPSTLSDYRTIDKNLSLEGDMLVKVDRTSMLNSLECRAPFLNKKLWDYTHSLPDTYLMKGWDKKYILKDAFRDQFPDGFLDKSKAGFGVPVGDWLRSSLRKELESYIAPKFLATQNIFEIGIMIKLVQEHLNGSDHTFKVWTFYCFQKWYKKNNP